MIGCWSGCPTGPTYPMWARELQLWIAVGAKNPAQETANAAEYPKDAPHYVLVRECVWTMKHLMMNKLILIYSVYMILQPISFIYLMAMIKFNTNCILESTILCFAIVFQMCNYNWMCIKLAYLYFMLLFYAISLVDLY